MEQVVVSGWLRDIVPNIYGYEECVPGHSFGPAVRPYYLLHYVLEGEGQFIVDDCIHHVYRGDIFVIRPGEVTTYRTGASNPWKYAWIGFYYPGQLACLQEAVIRQPPVRQVFTCIRDYHRQAGLDGKIFSLTHELIWQLTRREETSVRKTGSYAAYAKAYLENAYMQSISIEALADSLHIDRRYLTRLFKDTYAVPPQEYLMTLRMEKAVDFLKQGYSVTDAAQMAGFTDLSNFSRQFKRFFGFNPSRVERQKEN